MKYVTIENIYEHDPEHNDSLKLKTHIWALVKNLGMEVQQLKNSFYERKDPPQDQHNIETILKQQNTRCHTQ